MKIGDKLVPVCDYIDIPESWKQLVIVGGNGHLGCWDVQCTDGEIITEFYLGNDAESVFDYKVIS